MNKSIEEIRFVINYVLNPYSFSNVAVYTAVNAKDDVRLLLNKIEELIFQGGPNSIPNNVSFLLDIIDVFEGKKSVSVKLNPGFGLETTRTE